MHRSEFNQGAAEHILVFWGTCSCFV